MSARVQTVRKDFFCCELSCVVMSRERPSCPNSNRGMMMQICNLWIIFSCLIFDLFFVRFYVHKPTKDFFFSAHRPPILIGGRWYIFVPFVFLFLYFCLSKLLFLFWYASKGIVHPYTPFTSQLFVKLSLFCECRSKGMGYLCGVPSVERMWKSVPLTGFFISGVLQWQNLGSK